jgi:hypothetical protein
LLLRIPGIKAAQIKFMVNEVVQRIFKGAGKQLPSQINRKKPGTGVNVFVAGHLRLRNFVFRSTLSFDLVRGTMRQ